MRKKTWASIPLVLALMITSCLPFQAAHGAPASYYPGITVTTGPNPPVNVIAGPDGKLYIAEYRGSIAGTGNIVRVDADGQQRSDFHAGLNEPLGMAFDSSGNLFVSEHSGRRIGKIDASGNYTLIHQGPNRFGGLVLDSGGRIFAVDTIAGSIVTMDPDGGNVSTFVTGYANGSLFGLAIDDEDNLYVTDLSGSRIVKIAPDATTSNFMDLALPYWIAFGKDGYFYVSTQSNTILKVDRQGQVVATFGTGGQFPMGSYVTESGVIYFAKFPASIDKIIGTATAASTTKITVTMNTYMDAMQADPLAFALTGIASEPQVVTADVYGHEIRLSLDKPISVSDTSIKLNYSKTAHQNIRLTGSAAELEDFAGLPVWNDLILVVSANVPEIQVPKGTPLAALALPSAVNVTLSNTATATAAVVWDGGTPAYDGETAGTYAFSGALTFQEAAISNPNQIRASMNVVVQRSDDASLSGLALSSGTLSPSFASETITYSAVVDASSLTVTPVLSDAAATVTVNGNLILNGNAVIGLNRGENAIDIVVTAENGATKTYTLTVTRQIESSSDSGSESVASAPSPAANDSVEVMVNGKAEFAGTAVPGSRNGQRVITIEVNETALLERLEEEGPNAVLTIPVSGTSDVAIGELNGRMVKAMEANQAVLVLRTDHASYTLPARQINIDAISAALGEQVELQDVKVRIEMAASTSETLLFVEEAVSKSGLQLVVPPITFRVTAAYGDHIVDVSKFDAYVERTMALPEGVDANRVTTGVVIDPDGTVRHVPTRVVVTDGVYYAQIRSLTNSMYSVVWNPQEFEDVANHWAKDAVNDMGARMIVSGTGTERFHPEQDITRAEFAAIMVRGLGLRLDSGESVFKDVYRSDWYHSAIRTAYAYGLLGGLEDGAFRPNEKITREEAMSIVSKAMAVTGLPGRASEQADKTVLQAFSDAGNVSSWALAGVADSVSAGIFSGRSREVLAPQALITRAEAATVMQRLLQKSKLIDESKR